MAGVIAALVLVLVVGWAVGAYNHIIRLKNAVTNAFGQIDVQLKRRYDLIPNLVEVAKRYLQHEHETLEAVIAARNHARTVEAAAIGSPLNPEAIGALSVAEQSLAGQLGRLMVVTEAYPDLKADEQMRDLREELVSTENRVGFARQAYNDHVLEYNNDIAQFPTLLLAKLLGMKELPMLESTTSEEERAAPKVQF